MMRRRMMITLLAALTVSVLLCVNACALYQTNVTWVRTNERGATLRSSPERPLDDHNKIMPIHQYEYLPVYGKQGDWYYVYYEGTYGYVSANARWVSVASTEPHSQSEMPGQSASNEGGFYLVVGQRGVSLRSTPYKADDNSNKIMGIHAGETIEVITRYNKDWYYVNYYGTYGFVTTSSIYYDGAY